MNHITIEMTLTPAQVEKLRRMNELAPSDGAAEIAEYSQLRDRLAGSLVAVARRAVKQQHS